MRNKKGIEKGTSRDTVLWRGAGALARELMRDIDHATGVPR
jgi:hypothetical protein